MIQNEEKGEKNRKLFALTIRDEDTFTIAKCPVGRVSLSKLGTFFFYEDKKRKEKTMVQTSYSKKKLGTVTVSQ